MRRDSAPEIAQQPSPRSISCEITPENDNKSDGDVDGYNDARRASRVDADSATVFPLKKVSSVKEPALPSNIPEDTTLTSKIARQALHSIQNVVTAWKVKMPEQPEEWVTDSTSSSLIQGQASASLGSGNVVAMREMISKDTREIDRINFTDIIGLVVCKTRAESSIGLESSNVVTWREEGAFEHEIDLAKQVELGAADFGICTAFGTYHGGRIYLFRTDCRDTMERWSETITRVMTSYVGYPVVHMNRLDTFRRKVRWFYVGDRCQVFVAGIIMCNFLLNIFEAHFNAAPDTQLANVFDQIDLLFTIFFTVELVINIFATWFVEFVSDGWNWFDFGVVLVSLLSLVLTNLPGANILRLMRCFRVFRLFKRIPSLRQIMIALTASIPPMINAFALVCLVTAIYAIMSVTFFSSYAPEEFGDFFTGMFTMFQVMTGDNWSDIARGLFTLTGQNTGVAIFFVSFHLIVALVLLNVVIAVLLDEFSKAADQRNSEAEISKSLASEEIEACPFEKISRELSKYKNLDDLETKINNLYDKILYTTIKKKYDLFTQEVAREDSEILRVYFNRWKTGEIPNVGDGCMGFAEFRMGLKNIGFIPPILVTRQIWDDYIMRPRLCDEGGILNRQGFMLLMKQALKRHQLRQLNACMEDENEDWNRNNIRSLFLGIKGMLLEDEEHARLEKVPVGPMDDENSIASTRDGKVDASMEYDPQVDQLLKRLIADMHKMHARFDAVEMDLHAIRSARTRFKKGSPRNAVNGEKKREKEDAKKTEISELNANHMEDGHYIAKGRRAQEMDQSTVLRAKNESNAKVSDSFIEKQAATRRAMQTPASQEAKGADNLNNLSQRGGHLTHRGAAPDRMWSLGAFAQNFTDKTLSPVQVPDFSNPSKLVNQSKDAANKMMDGLMGGLATIGSNIPFVHGNGSQAGHE
ncbi:hypothetical protein GUITHDRAFT_113039 [Guillardia theta CCMP2712]|uniref:Ion transport domain-containing protein n=1 Tax=Guillardia theta (strain CCMP2712) TaxID=905079 RepID=L1IY33_GUITC|nr:hypothetical protein GUITHDRAFT_113039 [Guillardia theta CCMP2712]EKX40769.1 hypothetical protein GUITHDRAFT_113039 [Guillardia theta CCMP2712]|eukprot:XP_005827749.1 hypothetical protein GUITHDRAFT_113039 [Guillardia theta CCMP2712]